MKYSTIPYGNPPKVLGEINLDPTEHMLYLYLPIKMTGTWFWYPRMPKNTKYLFDLLAKVEDDFRGQFGDRAWKERYVYVTAKTCWVEPGAPGNRPGWHADGFGSNGDLNYIWYDMNPTEFAVMPFENIPTDDMEMLWEIEKQIAQFEWNVDDPIITYPAKTLLRLDESVVHRVNPKPKAGLRTFIKISVSKHKYNLKGNSHNYLFNYDWEMFDRADIRNTDNKDFVRSK